MVAKPASSSKVCAVCRDYYTEYLDVMIYNIKHIQSIKHKRALHKASFEKDIYQLCKKFKNQKKVENIVVISPKSRKASEGEPDNKQLQKKCEQQTYVDEVRQEKEDCPEVANTKKQKH